MSDSASFVTINHPVSKLAFLPRENLTIPRNHHALDVRDDFEDTLNLAAHYQPLHYC